MLYSPLSTLNTVKKKKTALRCNIFSCLAYWREDIIDYCSFIWNALPRNALVVFSKWQFLFVCFFPWERKAQIKRKGRILTSLSGVATFSLYGLLLDTSEECCPFSEFPLDLWSPWSKLSHSNWIQVRLSSGTEKALSTQHTCQKIRTC